MNNKTKFFITIALIVFSKAAHAGNDKNESNEFRRFHFTMQAGFNRIRVDEILTNAFAKELYQGTESLFSKYLYFGGSPENTSGIKPILNLCLDINYSKRLKIGIGINGIPETHVIGYINKDSLYTNPDSIGQIYDKVEEIVKGTTFKIQALYAIKRYHGNVGFGWELDCGAGLTCNFVNVKQKYLIQSLDSSTQEITEGDYTKSNKRSSIGAYLLGRLDVHLYRSFSVTGDFNWMFDTGIKIDETHFNFYDTTRQIDSHRLKFNSYLIAVGVAWHF